MSMKKVLAVSAMIAAAAGFVYLCTGLTKVFMVCAVAMIAALISWIMYEMELADQEIEMQIEEWMLEQEREHEVLITKTAIRRELIKVWEEIA